MSDKSKKLVSVTFTKSHKAYNKGDIAGFDSGFAEDLVKAKVAVKTIKTNKEK